MDYYKGAQKIGKLLQKEGLREVAENLINVIDEGMTATKILMGIKYHLDKAKKIKMSDITKKRILNFLNEIEKALQ